MIPIVVIVGRPNVGKSTLFNRLTRSRDAIVHDEPGITRDRHYGQGRIGGRPYLVVDTGGFEPVATEGIYHQMARQTRQAVDEADRSAFPLLAQAVADNQLLWGTLAEDLMGDGNRLPLELRANLISLAEFVRRHSMAVLGGRASAAALVDINTAIMKGLRGNAEEAA